MWPDRVSNPGPLTYESGTLPTALRGPATKHLKKRLSWAPYIWHAGLDQGVDELINF